MTTHSHRTRDADPTSMQSTAPAPEVAARACVPYALLGAALLSWVISLRLTDLDSLGPWGLIGAFPLLWYGSLAVGRRGVRLRFGASRVTRTVGCSRAVSVCAW